MAAAVEPPLTFFQESVKTVFWDTVEASQVTLCLVPKILDTIDVMTSLADESFAVVHASVMKLGHIQHIISPKAVGINNAVRLNFFSNDGDQRAGFGIRDDCGVNLAATL